MIPNMFKIAGEMTPTVFHVAARTVATHALSIFGDHSDVMACRTTGWAMLCSSSVQEAPDMALIAHSASLQSRIPFLHFFDGFRTSHELNCIEEISDDLIRSMLNRQKISEHRQRGLSPIIRNCEAQRKIQMFSFKLAKPSISTMIVRLPRSAGNG